MSRDPESIGAYLAAQRRLRGISVEELARQTRIPLRSLERLEAGSFDGNVDGFVRGFVRTVATALGLDADEALNRTLREPGSVVASASTPRLSVTRVLVAAACVTLVGAVALAVQVVSISLAGRTPGGGAGPIVVRRDPVRALAEAQGVAALSPAPALSLIGATKPTPRPAAARKPEKTALPEKPPPPVREPDAGPAELAHPAAGN